MEREEAMFKREMEQQDEDRARAEAAQGRRENEMWMDEEMRIAEEERDYF